MPAKSEETRKRILDAALELFRSKGFDRTTMREIAIQGGVATGAAYYYFASKEAIVFAFYEEAAAQMQPLIREALAGSKTLEERLRAVIDVKFQVFTPNRIFLGALLGHGADRSDPLSPFSTETEAIRTRDIGYFQEALEGYSAPKDLGPHLPKLLWLYQMALIFFWLGDTSPDFARTRKLLDRSLHMVVLLLQLIRLPILRPARKTVLELIQLVEE